MASESPAEGLELVPTCVTLAFASTATTVLMLPRDVSREAAQEAALAEIDARRLDWDCDAQGVDWHTLPGGQASCAQEHPSWRII